MPRQRQRHRTVARLDGNPPGHGRLIGVTRTNDDQPRDRAKRGQLFDRLVGRAVFTETDAVVRENVDHPQLHQRREPNRRAHVVGEDQERRSERNDSAVRRHAVACGAHPMLAHAEVQVSPGITESAPRRALAISERSLGAFKVAQFLQDGMGRWI